MKESTIIIWSKISIFCTITLTVLALAFIQSKIMPLSINYAFLFGIGIIIISLICIFSNIISIKNISKRYRL